MKQGIYKILLSVVLSFVVFQTTIAQEQPNLRMRAEQLFQRLEYHNAAKVYERLVDVKRPNVKDLERLAESYYLIAQYELAENWYAQASQNEGFSQQGLLNYADILKINNRHTEAKLKYEQYQSLYGVSDDIKLALAGADSAQIWLANPTGHKVKGESRLNTDLSEFGAIPVNQGILYAGEPKTFANRSGMTGQAYLKIFSASRDENQVISNPVVLPDVFNQAPYHVGPIAMNADHSVLFITRTYPGKSVEKYKSDGVNWRKSNLELKIYKRNGNDWEETDFPYNNVEKYSLGHATLSTDGKTLYYASDMPGGYGGVDIWYSELQSDNTWGAPQNAGPIVNSSKDEMFPNIVKNTLYYSSNGFAGMGGLDLYKVLGNRNSFSNRQNIGYPLNSSGDDFAYVSWTDQDDNVYGYLSSNRTGGVGGDDIYSFEYIKPKITIILEGITRNKKTQELISGAQVTLYSGGRQIVAKRVSDDQAEFTFELDRNSPYLVLAEKVKFHADSIRIAEINPIKDTTIRIALQLEPIFEPGNKFVLENIYYDFDKHNIRKDAAVVLDQLVRTMRDNPTLKIELSSHTDSRGSDSYNLKLSQRRAQSAVDYLVSRGIARDRLVAKGYGETRLVNKCSNGVPCSVAEHQANRRTEVEVLEF